MFILDQYKNQKLKSYTNEEYLALQIWQLENTFRNNAGAIKDINLNYIAMSKLYAEEFELTLDVSDDYIIFNNHPLLNDEIKKQEQLVIENCEVQDSLFIYKPSTIRSLLCYPMRKRPIINPTTNDIIGILVIAIKYKVGEFRAQYLKHVIGVNKKIEFNIPEKLTDVQQQIILCLLHGYNSRKEIAKIISSSTKNEVNEIRIKNLLSTLYDKFECNSSAQLIQIITKYPFEFELPRDLAEEGSNYLFWKN